MARSSQGRETIGGSLPCPFVPTPTVRRRPAHPAATRPPGGDPPTRRRPAHPVPVYRSGCYSRGAISTASPSKARTAAR